MAQDPPPVPIIAQLIDSVDLPKYPLGRPPTDELTEEGEIKRKSHENSRSVKNMAPVHYVVRGNPNDIVGFGKAVAEQQLLSGHYHTNDDVEISPLSTFSPPEKDYSLIHENEAAVVLSTYTHTVSNATRVCRHTKPLHPGRNVRAISNIVTLPEDTISFKAKLRQEHTLTDGTIRRAGTRDTLSLRCDLKVGFPVRINQDQPFDFLNARFQTILPLEFKKRCTFTAEDVEKAFMEDSQVPASVRKASRIGRTLSPHSSLPFQEAGPESEDNDIEMFDGDNDDVDVQALQGSGDDRRYDLRDRASHQRPSPETQGRSISAPVAANLKQMSAYSASERVPFSSLMTGDLQLFADFPSMVIKDTIEEQWDNGVGDYAIVYIVRKSGDWLSGLFGMLVWGWLFFMSLVD